MLQCNREVSHTSELRTATHVHGSIHDIANDDGLVFDYGVEIKEGAPQYILDKLARLPRYGNLISVGLGWCAGAPDQE